ncbi:hypothetical protein F5B19DRAFT_488994 [Rostrohypoxylon terebratum]|nr:hypothetical protein F5B19DRAFT_488994 [Rostrohypoxylon terebratum]
MAPAKPWTEDKKVSLLVQAILAMNGSFPHDKVSLPGRTPKSLTHAWTHARAQHAAYMEHCGGDNSQPVTPTPPRVRKSKKRKIEDTASDDDEDYKPRAKKSSFSSSSSKYSSRSLDSEKGKIKGEPDSPSDESNGMIKDEA